MALDTRDRRASAVHVGLPWRGLLPLPDGAAEDQGDRQQAGGYYRGVPAAPIFAVGLGDMSAVAASEWHAVAASEWRETSAERWERLRNQTAEIVS